MWKYCGKNIRPFTALTGCRFGRQIITTIAGRIDASNVVKELNNALPTHNQNAKEIDYLDRYYRGDQPILYRRKTTRPEVNNKIVENLAYMIVETKTAEIVGEPIQYILNCVDDNKSKQVEKLNVMLDEEDKHYYDIELKRWSSICGTAYRFIGNDEGKGRLLDNSPFYLSIEDPRYTFMVYFPNGKEAFSCQIRENEDGNTVYYIYTNAEYFIICNNEIIDSGLNGNGAIPVVEYPNNSRRLSDIEITITMTDEINKMASDRVNGIEQFVSSWVKFINCEVDEDSFLAMRQEGALVVKSNEGNNNADVDIITSELNQTESQVAVSDQYEKLLVIQGMASRQENTGGDTQGAVELRNGHYDSEKRAELSEPVWKRAERQSLRLILNRLRIMQSSEFDLMASDVEIHISRSKLDNMQVKAQVLQMLLNCGIEESIAIKVVGLFSDAERTYLASKDRMSVLYPKNADTSQKQKENKVSVE